MKMTTWPRLWLGVRGVLCVAQFSWMSLATNERNKTGMWCWGETIKEKRNTSICVPLIVLIFSFAIFNSFFFFVGRGGSSERNHPSDSACALLCSAWSGPPPSVCLFFFLFQKRNTMERLEMRNWRSSSRASEREANIHIIFFFVFYFSICVSSSLYTTPKNSQWARRLIT